MSIRQARFGGNNRRFPEAVAGRSWHRRFLLVSSTKARGHFGIALRAFFRASEPIGEAGVNHKIAHHQSGQDGGIYLALSVAKIARSVPLAGLAPLVLGSSPHW